MSAYIVVFTDPDVIDNSQPSHKPLCAVVEPLNRKRVRVWPTKLGATRFAKQLAREWPTATYTVQEIG